MRAMNLTKIVQERGDKERPFEVTGWKADGQLIVNPGRFICATLVQADASGQRTLIKIEGSSDYFVAESPTDVWLEYERCY